MEETTYHFIGIGGIGMSALARILLQKGKKVSGSDLAVTYVTEGIKKAGAQVFHEQAPHNLNASMKVVYSTDIALDNPEYKEAGLKNLPLYHRSELLAELMNDQAPLLVAGTHGKTTTSSLLAHVMIASGLDPSYAVGGILRGLNSNGGYGRGEYFVAEACESDGTFLKYPCFGGIITNIDNDHMSYWKTEKALLKGFKDFAEGAFSKEHLFYCADDPYLPKLGIEGVSYGLQKKAQLHITAFKQVGWKIYFDCTFENKTYKEIEVSLIGVHNVLNAAAVFGLAIRLDIPEEKIRSSLKTFPGVARRMDKKGEKRGIAIYDDYGHHPTELSVTLKAVKSAIGKERLVVAFQPHRYTRTKDCMEQFAEALDAADEIFVTEIFAAGEKPIEGVTTDTFLQKLKEKGKKPAKFFPRKELAAALAKFLKSGDTLVTMGAGDVTKLGVEVLELL